MLPLLLAISVAASVDAVKINLLNSEDLIFENDRVQIVVSEITG